MKDRNLNALLLKYNSIFKETEDVYHGVSRQFGLSECAMLILYILRTTNQIYTQSEICAELFMPKQTVNSALKKLEDEGYLELLRSDKNKKSKQIIITEKGLEFSTRTIDKMIIAEQNAFTYLTEEEQDQFLRLYGKYVYHLREEINQIKDTK